MIEQDLPDSINEMMDKEIIDNFAIESGFMKRRRKITPVEFLLVLAFRSSKSIPISLRNIASYIKGSVSRIAVHRKFNASASLFLWKCLQHSLHQQVNKYKLETSLLDNFSNVKIIDSSSWKISPGLRNVFPGAGGSGSKAGCKLQLIYEYKTGVIYFTELTEGTYPDQKYSMNIAGKILKNDLFIFDLGYCTFALLKEIEEKEAYFVSRYNTSAGLWIKAEDEFIKFDPVKFLENQNKSSLEFDVFLKKDNDFLKIRLVSFRVPEKIANLRKANLKKRAKKKVNKKGDKKEKKPQKRSLYLCNWSIFITNCNEEIVPGEVIRSIYRVRWCIELLFKNWKSILNLHKNNAKTNEHRIRCEIYAKLIFAVIIHTTYQYTNFYLWDMERKEISFWCIWNYIVDRAQLLHETIRISVNKFISLLKSYLPDILINCQKYKQPSRKTTLVLIDNMIGDKRPVKISEFLLLNFCLRNA